MTEIPQASRLARGDRLTEMKKIVRPYSPENPHKFKGSTLLKKVSNAYTGDFEKRDYVEIKKGRYKHPLPEPGKRDLKDPKCWTFYTPTCLTS